MYHSRTIHHDMLLPNYEYWLYEIFYLVDEKKIIPKRIPRDFSEKGTRTPDRADMSRLLYQLSYLAIVLSQQRESIRLLTLMQVVLQQLPNFSPIFCLKNTFHVRNRQSFPLVLLFSLRSLASPLYCGIYEEEKDEAYS